MHVVFQIKSWLLRIKPIVEMKKIHFVSVFIKKMTELAILILLVALSVPLNALSQNPDLKKPKHHQQVSSSSNQFDLELVKPLINFYTPNGGCYSNYYVPDIWYDCDSDIVYLGAIVKNSGCCPAYNVFLEADFIIISDTLPMFSPIISFLDSGSTDTIYFSPIPIGYYWQSDTTKFRFTVRSDSMEFNQVNNSFDVPFAHNDGTLASRSSIPTGTIDVNAITNFQSGDFIGTVMKFKAIDDIGVFLMAPLPDSVKLTAQIYCNQHLIFSAPVLTQSNMLFPRWIWDYPSSIDYWCYPDNSCSCFVCSTYA